MARAWVVFALLAVSTAVVAATPGLVYAGVWIVVDSALVRRWGGVTDARDRAVNIFSETERFFGVSRNGTVTPPQPPGPPTAAPGSTAINGTVGYPLPGARPRTSARHAATSPLDGADVTIHFDVSVATDTTGIGNVDKLNLRLYHVWVTALTDDDSSVRRSLNMRTHPWRRLTKRMCVCVQTRVCSL